MSESMAWRDDREAFGLVLEQHRRDLVLLAFFGVGQFGTGFLLFVAGLKS